VPAAGPVNGESTFRETLARFATGVTFVTAEIDGAPVGMVANAFTSVSLAPPLVAFCPSRSSTTWPRIEQAARFGVNVLAHHHAEFCRSAAVPGAERFADLEFESSLDGPPVLADALAFLDCTLETVYPAGDHWIALGRVSRLWISEERRPLIFYASGYGSFAPADAACR
jgi:3-hydroxy-9,10-secoandrosta-1,3,5(10)-triene-9,17-dione monooxygenase reductase component